MQFEMLNVQSDSNPRGSKSSGLLLLFEPKQLSKVITGINNNGKFKFFTTVSFNLICFVYSS